MKFMITVDVARFATNGTGKLGAPTNAKPVLMGTDSQSLRWRPKLSRDSLQPVASMRDGEGKPAP